MSPDRRLRRPSLLGLFVVVGATVSPLSAEIVVLSGGGFLKATGYEVRDSRVTVALPGGGVVRLPLTRVERIVADEIVLDPVELGGGSMEVRLHHDPDDPAPDVPYGEQMLAVAADADINPELLAAMARAESAFDARALSRKGARGLMQIMPATGRRFGAEPEALFDPEVSLRTAARYLSWLRGRFEDDLDLILAAYNSGEATVDRYGGVPPYRETREYISRVRRYLSGEGRSAAQVPSDSSRERFL